MSAKALPEPKHPIGSVGNALKLLLMFRDKRAIRVSEASEALGVGRSTAHRLMAMLAYHALVEQDPQTKAYTSGPALREIGLRVVHQMDMRTHMRPYLERLARAVNETVHLIVLDEGTVLFVDGIECTRPVRTGLRIGISRPAHCTSGGKVLLAELPLAELRELYPSARLATCTNRSVRTRAALERQLADVRASGYSLNIGESEPDLAAIAMPVRDERNCARGAVGISVPLARFDDGYAQRLLGPLRDTVFAAGVGLA